MKVFIDDIVTAQRTFLSDDELVEAYRESAARHGQFVPSHSLAYLLVSIADFLATWCAERSLSTLVDWRKERRVEQERLESKAQIESLEKRLDAVESNIKFHGSAEEVNGSALSDLARAGSRVIIILETPVEAKLAGRLTERLPDVTVTISPANK